MRPIEKQNNIMSPSLSEGGPKGVQPTPDLKRLVEFRSLSLEQLQRKLATEKLILQRYLLIAANGKKRHTPHHDDAARLGHQLVQKSRRCADLEDQLVRVLEKNTELTIQNTDLQKQVHQLQNVSGESRAGGRAPTTRPADSLEAILKDMRDASDKRKELERQHAEALAELRDTQGEIQRVTKHTTPTSTQDKTKSFETIEALQSKIRELEKKTELQNVRHEELLLEMASIKRTSQQVGQISAANQSSASWKSHAQDGEVECESNLHHDTDRDRERDRERERERMEDRACAAAVDQAGDHQMGSNRPRPQPGGSHPPRAGSPQPPASSEIDRIMAKIDQDNRILAELDKTRSTIGMSSMPPSSSQADRNMSGSSYAQSGLPLLPSQAALHQSMMHPQPHMVQMPSYQGQGQYMLPGQSALQHNFIQQQPRMMPQIPAGVVPPPIPTIMTTHYDLERMYQSFPGAEHLLGPDNKVVDMLDIPGKGRCYVYIARYSYDPFQQSPNDNPEAELPVHAGDYLLVWGHMDEDGFFDGELLDGRRGLVPSNFIQKLVGEDLLEFHQAVVLGLRDCDDSVSTNVAHEFDFSTHNDMGFLIEETYGRRSLPGEFGYVDLEDILEEEDDLNDQTGEGPVPPPKQLTLERQLNKSVLIGWNPPDAPTPIDSYHVYVDGVLKTTVKASERTRALVEGVDSNRPHRISVRSITPNRRTSRDAACTMVIGKDVPLGPSHVKASNLSSTSAVISWLPSNSNHQHAVCVNNVEVRTVKPGVYRHTITGLAPNTIYRVTVRAKNIRAPHFDEKQNQSAERFSCHIDFRTLPKGKGCKGLPDPPIDIQVEAGPQDGTLLVTWLPVTVNGSTNGALVTGYAVYADGKKVTDVDSPTGDHALIDINKLVGLNPKQVTVRTKSRDSQSTDSLPTPIPSNVLKGKMKQDAMDMKNDRRRYGSAVPPHMRGHHRRDAHGQMIIETEENLSDKEIYPNHMNIPAIEITKDSASEGNFSEDDYIDGRRGRGGGFDPRSVPRSHAERGRPPGPPHERGRMDSHHRRPDERDPYYMDSAMRGDPRGRPPGDRGYRGPPPGRGGPHGPAGANPRDKRTRWFVALFDYDPTTMSPNPDACEEELPFSEGDPIKIYGEKDADGFYWGECRGRRGYVPHNMVVEVQEMPKNSVEGGRGNSRDRDRWGDIYANQPTKKMIALYDYDPQELSPNVDAEQVELSFNTGNVIYVFGDMDDDGFYLGELDGMKGLVPSNFLTEAPPDYSGSGPRQRGPPRGMGGGHGPGARGPPPPPRDPRMDPRDRRKDACSLPTQIDYRAGEQYHNQGPAGMRGRGEGRGVPRGGRGGPPPGGGGWGGRGPPPARDYRDHPNQEYHNQDQQGMLGEPAAPPGVAPTNTPRPPSKPLKGVPAVVPDFVIPSSEVPPVAPAPAAGPNLMQKFTEMTGVGGPEASVDNLLSKGKELIFMKFGLGK